MKILCASAFLLMISYGASGTILAQMGSQPPQTPGIPGPADRGQPINVPASNDAPDLSPEMQHQIAMNLRNERQKKLINDTNQLLALATDLKQQMDKTSKDMLSIEVIKKADEIERLAHNIKQEMKN